MAKDRKELIKDPHLPWHGEFPYDRLNAALARAGRPPLGPDSTAREIRDAYFDLMAAGRPAGKDRAAWDDLRLLERRLLVDFFLYEVPALTDDSFDPERWVLPMPIAMPDFLLLAAEPPELTRLEVPERFDPGPPPAPLPANSAARPLLDLGDLAPDLEIFLRPDGDE